MGDSTKPELFIIESLALDDETERRSEGDILSRILGLSGKSCRYYYIRTERELVRLVEEFADSRFRYLHLSCHANDEEMATTFDPVSFNRLADILSPHIEGRRIFLSACKMATPELAIQLLREGGCFSVLGPAEDIEFGDAALLWSSFYHLMFRTNPAKMQRSWVKTHVQSTADLFNVRLNLFVRDAQKKSGTRRYAIRPT